MAAEAVGFAAGSDMAADPARDRRGLAGSVSLLYGTVVAVLGLAVIAWELRRTNGFVAESGVRA